MSFATIADGARPEGVAPVPAGSRKHMMQSTADVQRIPAAFQLLLAFYIIFTGDFPTIVQALAFGLPGGGGAEFTLAVLTSLTRDLLLLIPMIVFARHPLGIVHPLILAVILWPLVIKVPEVIEQYGGWAGVLAGEPVQTPLYYGLRSLDPSTVWTAVAKYNGVQIVALASTYFGFWLFRTKRNLSRIPPQPRSTAAIRNVLLGLFCMSMLTLVTFVYFRGGLSEHVTSLGQGRFEELAGTGPIIVIITMAAMVLYVWVAARPGDVKSPLFLACLAAVIASQFISNGSRGAALMVPLIIGIIWSMRRRKVPWKLGLALIPIMFVTFGLLGAIRTSSWQQSTAGEAWSETGWAESLEVAQKEMALRQAVSAQVPVVARGFQVSDGPMLGETYLAALTALIPRAIWEDKPRGPGSLYGQLFFGESGEGAGIPVGSSVEMYWNFGWPGVVLLSIVYGALLRAAYHFLWRRYPDPFAIVFVVIFATTFHISTKRLVDFQQLSLLLLLCYLAVTFFLPKTVSTFHNRLSGEPQRVLSRA